MHQPGAQSRRVLLHLAAYGSQLQSRVDFGERHLAFAEDGW